MLIDHLRTRLKPEYNTRYRTFWQYIHIDVLLLTLLLILSSVGLLLLYSSSNQNFRVIEFQAMHLLLAFLVMFIIAQIPPSTLLRFAPWLYTAGLITLVLVLMMGHIGKGGQRWLNFSFIHFQPAETMKLGIPLFVAWYYHRAHLPLKFSSFIFIIPFIVIPAFLTAKQPDLGTGILLLIAGSSALFLAGLSFQVIVSTSAFLGVCIPFGWYFMHDYQKHRVLTFLYPESDPLGNGYHIIQSKIAIGSGGLFGKGWLNGTQSNLHFLPEHSTDFIFAVCGEEFGFIGSLFLITLYIFIVLRGLYITIHAQDTFTRLIAGSITFTFFVSFFINMGMVTGLLPVVGMPLPLISYGGSSMMTIMASFGVLMSIQTHRKLVTT